MDSGATARADSPKKSLAIHRRPLPFDFVFFFFFSSHHPPFNSLIISVARRTEHSFHFDIIIDNVPATLLPPFPPYFVIMSLLVKTLAAGLALSSSVNAAGSHNAIVERNGVLAGSYGEYSVVVVDGEGRLARKAGRQGRRRGVSPTASAGDGWACAVAGQQQAMLCDNMRLDALRHVLVPLFTSALCPSALGDHLATHRADGARSPR